MKKLFAVILSLGLIMSPVPVVNTAHASGGGGYLKVVLGMANGIVGSAILLKCKMGASQPSITIYFAGSLVYVAAEVLGGKTKKRDVNHQAANMDSLKAQMKEGGDYQRASVEAQIANEESTLKHIEKKLTWMRATKVIYGIATAVAFIEWILQFPPPPAGIGIGKPDIGACSPDGVTHKAAEASIVMAYTAAQGYAGSGLMGAGMALATPYIMKMLGAVAIGTQIQDLAVTMLNTSLGRVAFFGAATMIVQKLEDELNKEAQRSRDIIAKLKSVLGTFQDADNSLAEGSMPGSENGDRAKLDANNKGKQYALKKLPEARPLSKHCYSNSGQNGLSFSEEGCKNSYKLTKPKLDGQFNIPTLVAGANSSMEMAQAISDGDTARADIEAGNLAAMAGRVDAINKELMKKVNDELKKQGKKPVDFNDELKRQVAAMNAGLNKQNPGSGNFTTADLDSSNTGAAAVSETKPSEGNGEINAAAVPTPGAQALDLSSIDSGATSEEVTDPNADPNKVASLSDSLGEFESSASEISKDRDVSIFKQVSNRYFLNYTKLFEKKKIDPPLSEPASAGQ